MKFRIAIAILLGALIGLGFGAPAAMAQETGNPPVTVIPIPGLNEPEAPPAEVEPQPEVTPEENVPPPVEPTVPPTTIAPVVEPQGEGIDGEELIPVGLVGAALVLLGLIAMLVRSRRNRDKARTVPVRLPAMTQALQPPRSNHPFEILRADFIGGEEKDPMLHPVGRFNGYDTASDQAHELRKDWHPHAEGDTAWWIIRSEITGLIVLIIRSDRDVPPDWVANARLQERLAVLEPGAQLKRAT